MLEHLDDPNPPQASPLLAERIAAEGSRRVRRRHRTLASVAAVAVVLVAVGGLLAVTDRGDRDQLDVVDDGTASTATSVPETTATTTTDDTLTRPADMPATFAAVTLDGDVVLADSMTGRVVSVVVDLTPTDDAHGRAEDVALAPDGSLYYSTLELDGDTAVHTLWRVDAGAHRGERLGVGRAPHVSPDGTKVAYVSDFDAVTILDRAGGTSTSYDHEDHEPRGITWAADSERLLVEIGQPEAPSWIVILDPVMESLEEAERLGPPEDLPAGTGWYTPDLRTFDGLIGLVQSCCALDANSYVGGTSFLVIDPSTGEVRGSIDVPSESDEYVAQMEYDPSGRHQLVVFRGYQASTLYRRSGADWTRVETPTLFAAVDW